MTRTEYFVHYRTVLQELDDRTLGIYLWHCSGQFNIPASIPPKLSILELYDRIFPNFTPEFGAQKVGSKPTAATLQRLAEHRSSTVIPLLKGGKKDQYESTVLAIGQQARDLLTGNATALWNVFEERRRQLDVEWNRQNDGAIQAEKTAEIERQRANIARDKLDATLAELERLAKIKTS